MALGRIMQAEVTTLPYAQGQVFSLEVITAVELAQTASGRIMGLEVRTSSAVPLPLPVFSVSAVQANKGYRIVGSASASQAEEWAWSLDGPVEVTTADATIDIFIPASKVPLTRTLFARYRVDDTWSDGVSVDVTIPEWPYWLGKDELIIPYTLIKGIELPAPAVNAKGRVMFLSAETATEITPEVDADILTPATGTPSEGLFFELPTPTQISTGAHPERMILAHYYGPQPGAFSNAATDYYETGYLTVNGESGIHAAYGGLMRDRPMLGAPFATTPVSWQRTMQGKEIQAAKGAGIDGFFVNIMGSSGSNWDRYMLMAQEAAANYPGFKVVPMVDGTASMALNESVAVCADRLNQLLSLSSAWVLPDGRYVVSAFKMEGVANRADDPKGPAYWSAVSAAMQSSYGKDVAWIGTYNNINQAVNYAGVQYAAGQWGPGADPGIYSKLTNYGTAIKARGEKFLFGLWAQDVRPRSDLFDEACNTGALRAGLDAAIRQNADIIQFCTWSDHTEGSMIRPTVKQGYGKLDIAAYRIAKWKTGKYPRILRDAVYVSYRNQMLTATITGGQTRSMTQWARTNRSPTRENVEVLTYFTAPAEVTIKVGATTYAYTAPAGEFSYLAPMEPGEVSVKATRLNVEFARINAPVVIKNTAVNQDREYAWFSSLRGTAGQYDPTPGSPVANAANYLA